VTRFGTTAQGMGLRIGGPGERVNDLAAIGWGDGSAPISLATADESLTATGHAWIRIHADRVEAWGGITALRLRIPATVTGLTLNGVATPCRIGNGRINMPVP
jgi:hypothetical protein